LRALVTGATGFVGSAVVRSLLRRGFVVRALARHGSDLRNLGGLDLEIYNGDLLDEEGIVGALCGCHVLYHVAAYYGTAEADSPAMYEVNVRGTKAVMRAALRSRVRRVVHTSTIGTIGQPADGSLATEATPFADLWDTASHYVKSKYLAEVVVLTMCEQGLPAVIVHPCAPVGPRDIKPSSTGQRLLDYLHGRQPSFVPGGINFVSVEDVAEGHVLAAEKGLVGEHYILGHRDGNLSLAAFVALMERVSGVKPSLGRKEEAGLLAHWRGRYKRLAQQPARHERRAGTGVAAQGFRPIALTCDPSKAIRELGLPQTPLERAFSQAIAWFRENSYVHV